MKKMKKFLAMFLALAMMMGLSLTSFAADTAKITVNGLSTAAEQTVKIYQIYGPDANKNDWVVMADWAKEVIGDRTPGQLEEVLTELRSAAPAEVPAANTKTNKTGTVDAPVYTGTVEFTDVNPGVYLVLATGEGTTYSPMLAVTYGYDDKNLFTAKDAVVVAKAEGYTITKTQEIVGADSDVAEVGDLIKYTIKTTVPYMADDVGSAVFSITDTITGTAGAKYFFTGTTTKGQAGELSVTVGGQAKTDLVDEIKAKDGNKTFTLDMNSYVNEKTNPVPANGVGIYKNEFAGQQVVITYTVQVTSEGTVKNAVVNSEEPDTPSETTTYTGEVEITKYGVAAAGAEKPKLSGAEFAVYRQANNNDTERWYASITDGKITDWVKVAKTGEGESAKWPELPSTVGKITTGPEGTATVKGLGLKDAAGDYTYYFQEVKAPQGYTINTTPSPATLTRKENVTGEGEDKVITVEVSGTTSMDDTKLIDLPSTGGVGTTLFTIGGCAIMIIIAGMYFSYRRRTAR